MPAAAAKKAVKKQNKTAKKRESALERARRINGMSRSKPAKKKK